MTKVRTIIPANAKPGQSVIQVEHPKTGKPTRVQVPKEAIPGQMVELDLPDGKSSSAKASVEPKAASIASSVQPEKGERDQSSDTVSTASVSTPSVSYGSFGPVVVVPPPTQVPTPPPFGTRESHGADITTGKPEMEPLLTKPDHENRGWWANPCGICTCLFAK